MKAKIVELDVRGLDYIKSELGATNDLGHRVLSAIDLNNGRVVSVLPESHGPNVYAFKQSVSLNVGRERIPIRGGYMEAVPSTRTDVASWAHAVLNSGSHRA